VPVTRRSLAGAGLAGLGSALAGLGELRVKRRAFQEQAQAEHDQKMQDKLLETYISLSKEVSADPSKYATLQPVAQQFGLSLPKPADAQTLKPLTAQINTAKSPLDLPSDVGAAAESLGVRAVPAADPMTGAGSQFADPSMPFASTADMNPPAVANLADLAMRRKTALAAEEQRQIGVKGQEAQSTAYNTGLGANQAKNENFPTELDQKGQEQQQSITAELGKARQMIPIATQQAGAVAGATARAGLAPDIVQAEADKAGQIAKAQADAKPVPVDDKVRQTVSFFVRAASAANNATGLEGKGLSPVGAALPNALRSSMGQQYNQAIDEFALSVLRKESGAAISPSEHAQFAQTYFAQPGDSPQTIAEKQQARQRVLDGLKFEADPGLKEFQSLGNQLPIVVAPGSTLNRLVPPGKKP
jgi:hypothetical protein